MQILIDKNTGQPVCQPVDLGKLPDHYQLHLHQQWRMEYESNIIAIYSHKLNKMSHEQLVQKCINMFAEGTIALSDMDDPDLFELYTNLRKELQVVPNEDCPKCGHKFIRKNGIIVCSGCNEETKPPSVYPGKHHTK